ncbi:hypothetical protein J2X69_001239 [Algoriphagus sp. 4150]|uniref:tRNA modification GTPase n=1 Tax=Algoriphagus sp. 4150 TaxID=2817756 RepID=UPI00285C5369|nr:tRNA modification GTPase [Algoriphagus sp. 4150]MDR7128907.1 hypothetical protein [Algoriphagus sp. 4150]
MKKALILLAALIIHCNSFAQILFEEGHFLTNSNEKIACLIKNSDWKNNPSTIEYKLASGGPVQHADIQAIKEFEINGFSKFIRATVQIDESGQNLNNLGEDRSPKFVTREVFLKTIIEGQASLFSFESNNTKRYFYSINGSEITQLVYKKYKIDNRISENTQFRNQLNNQLVCGSINSQEFKNLGYKQKELESIFVKYNECTDSSYTTYGVAKRPDLFHLSIRPGISARSLTIENPQAAVEKVDFENNLGFRIGVEAEFILPFNKNKWGVIIEPTFQSYKSEKTASTKNSTVNTYNVTADYKSLELPIGLRHYMFLNANSKLFINLSYIIDFPSKTTIGFERSDGAQGPNLSIKTGGSFGLGTGFQYNNKLHMELRYHTNREIIGGYHFWNSNYQSLNLIFGYTLF